MTNVLSDQLRLQGFGFEVTIWDLFGLHNVCLLGFVATSALSKLLQKAHIL